MPTEELFHNYMYSKSISHFEQKLLRSRFCACTVYVKLYLKHKPTN